MSAQDVIMTVLAVAVLSAIVVAANVADRDRRSGMQRAVFATLILINGLIVMLYGVMQTIYAFESVPGTGEPAPGKMEAIASLILAVITGGLATGVLYGPVRRRLARYVPGMQQGENNVTGETAPEMPSPAGQSVDVQTGGTPLFPQMLNYYTTDTNADTRSLVSGTGASFTARRVVASGGTHATRGFNPSSTVHLVAVVFCIYLLGVQLLNFVLGGGLEGVAESLSNDLTGWDLALNSLPLLIIPVLGAGLGTRRTASQILDRLGLTMPTMNDVLVSFGATIALLIFVAIVSMLWMGAVSEETYKEQTKASEALAESVGSLGIAFLLAATAAVSEEIAFRGALQPVVGFWPTAIIFALTHAQYTLTPAALIILVVAVGFGWIRKRYSTTAAIMTHFSYNFIPLALSVSVGEEGILLILQQLV